MASGLICIFGLLPMCWISCHAKADCGKFFLKPGAAKYGDILDIVYKPTSGIANHPDRYVRIYWIINESCPGPNGCELTNSTKGYQMLTVSEKEYVLRIPYLTENVDGQYKLQCTDDRTENIFTAPLTVKAPELEHCGRFYQRTHNVRLGDVMELGYSPAPAVKNFTGDYTLIYRIENDTCPNLGCELTNTTEMYKLMKEENDKYVLRIMNLTVAVNGEYVVQCTHGRTKNVYTNAVNVRAPERPNHPILNGTTYVTEGCQDCIIGKLGKKLNIKCNVSGGTPPLDVKIFINGTNMPVSETKKFNRSVVENVTLGHHEMEVKCTVNNLALNEPLETSSKIYVAVKPSLAVEVPDEMRLDDVATFAFCSCKGGRPAGQMTLTVGNSSELLFNRSVNTSKWISQETKLYLDKPNRDWNGKEINCTHRQSLTGYRRKKRETLIFKFPPETVSITPGPQIQEILPRYQYNVSCIVTDYYPQCNVSWSMPSHFINTTDIGTEYKKTTITTVSLNVSKDDIGTRVTCEAICSGNRSISSYNSHTILVPYNPEIHFNLSSVYVNITEGENIRVTCSVDSYPRPRIHWYGSNNTTLSECSNCTENSLHLQNMTLKDAGVYQCRAKNKFSDEFSKNLTVHVHDHGQDQRQRRSERDEHLSSDDSSPKSYEIVIAITSVVVIIVCSIVIAVFCRKRIAKEKEAVIQRPAGEDRDVGNNEYVSCPGATEETGDVTYAVVTRRENRHEPLSETSNVDIVPKKELIYADLDLPNPSERIIGTSETEYVQIDFTKRAAPLPDSKPTEEAENIYMNN